jgi:hypothetical protein
VLALHLAACAALVSDCSTWLSRSADVVVWKDVWSRVTWNGMRACYPPLPHVELCTRKAPCHVEGALDPGIVRRYTKRHIMRLLACYESELPERPALGDSTIFVHVDFVIGETGKVRSAIGHSADPAITYCVTDTIAGVMFPSRKSDTRASYTFAYFVPK